jgi:hypothetical protein
MRRLIRGVVGLAAAGWLVTMSLPSSAQNVEKKLLGISILRPWSDVLKKHGQPTRIAVGAVTGAPTPAPQSGAIGAPGVGFPGGPMAMMGAPRGPMAAGIGMPGAPMMSGAAPSPSMMSGYYGAMMRGMSGAPGMPPGTGGGGGAPGPGLFSGYYGTMMRPGGSGPSTSKMSAMMGGGTLPGLSGLGPGAGADRDDGVAFPGAPGVAAGFGPAAGAAADSLEGEVTWIYERGANTDRFLFNKDGRVVQIESFGYKNGGVTAQGVSLGDPLSKIYLKYGWPGRISKSGNTMTLDYSQKSHALFYLVDQGKGKGYRVVGITVALMEKGGL